MKVRDYMTQDVIPANLKDGLRQTFYRMRERHVRHMPVIDEREILVGLISDRDLRRPDWLDAAENVTHPYMLDNSIKVEEAMAKNPKTMGPDDDIRQALETFLEHHHTALPVVDQGRKVVGILSRHDMLRAFHDHLAW